MSANNLTPELTKLIEWISETAYGELDPSAMFGLTPVNHVVPAQDLLDQVHDIWGIPKQAIKEIVDPIADRRDAERHAK